MKGSAYRRFFIPSDIVGATRDIKVFNLSVLNRLSHGALKKFLGMLWQEILKEETNYATLSSAQRIRAQEKLEKITGGNYGLPCHTGTKSRKSKLKIN
jgi:hypothetical protein